MFTFTAIDSLVETDSHQIRLGCGEMERY